MTAGIFYLRLQLKFIHIDMQTRSFLNDREKSDIHKRAWTCLRAREHTLLDQLVHVLEVHRKRNESAPEKVREVPLTSDEFWAYYKQHRPSHVSDDADCAHGEAGATISTNEEKLQSLHETLEEEKGKITEGFSKVISEIESTLPNHIKVQEMKDLKRIFDRCLHGFSTSLKTSEEPMIFESRAIADKNQVKETDYKSLMKEQEIIIGGLIELDLEQYMILIV